MRIGTATFLKGLEAYFSKFKWSNNTLDDFIECMQEIYDPNSNNLRNFTSKWLKTKGVNSFNVELISDNSAFILR